MHIQGVHLSPLGFAASQSKKCTNKAKKYTCIKCTNKTKRCTCLKYTYKTKKCTCPNCTNKAKTAST